MNRYDSASTFPHMGRRSFLAATAAAIAAPAVLGDSKRDWSGKNPTRYPDPDIIVLEKEFAKYKIGNTPIQRLYTGMLWAEGCAWNAAGQYLVMSDIPNNRQLRWLDEDGHVSVFRKPSNYSNGNTFDFEGRQISFEHGTRRVVRYEHDGSVKILADKYERKPFNAPNDGAVYPDGGIWFTDPGYGALMNYEGHKGKLELKEAIYRIDAKTGKCEKMNDEMFKPNGLCFSPDYKTMYVADTGASHNDNAPKNITMFEVIDGKKLGPMKEFCSMSMDLNGKKVAGFADGIRADVDGNIWVGSGWVGDGYDGVQVFNKQGKRIGMILLPEICANICFGGKKRNRLFMAASQSLYAVYVETQGAGVT